MIDGRSEQRVSGPAAVGRAPRARSGAHVAPLVDGGQLQLQEGPECIWIRRRGRGVQRAATGLSPGRQGLLTE